MTQRDFLALPIRYSSGPGRLVDATGEPVCMVYAHHEQERAEFMVQAVNAHDDLLTALEDAVHQLEQCDQGSCRQTAEACRATIAIATSPQAR